MLNPTVNRSSALNNGYQVVLQSQEFHLKPFIFSPFAPEPPVTRHLCGSTSLVLLIVMSSVLTGEDSFTSYSNLWRRRDDERWWLVCFSQRGHKKGKKTMTQCMEKSNPKILLKAFPETVCCPVLQILNLFQTKKCHFPHPFSDLSTKK